MDALNTLIDGILKREGWPKYTDHPADRGGPTKGGITLRTLTAWRGRPCTAADVAALTEEEVRAIYRRQYVEQPGFDRITDPALRELVVDAGVLHGQPTAALWLQRAVNAAAGRALVAVDGKAGPQTMAAVARLPAAILGLLMVAERVRGTGRIVSDDARCRGRTEDQALNAAGWANRTADLLIGAVLALPRP